MKQRYGHYMPALGISIEPSGGNPRLQAVILEGTRDEPVLLKSFELRTADGQPSEQAVDLARLLQGRLPGLQFDMAGIRSAGTSPVARRNRAQFSRAHAEGAVLFVIREHLQKPVLVGDVQSYASASGIAKADLVARAAAVSGSTRYREAAIPAIALLEVR